MKHLQLGSLKPREHFYQRWFFAIGNLKAAGGEDLGFEFTLLTPLFYFSFSGLQIIFGAVPKRKQYDGHGWRLRVVASCDLAIKIG